LSGGEESFVDINEIKVIALDLDGTLTQHKTRLEDKNRNILDLLRKKYRLLMVGAGECTRIFMQMNRYPIDIIGNYGLQYGKYDPASQNLVTVFSKSCPCEKDKVTDKITKLRKVLGREQFIGDTVEFHHSGSITFPLLGTGAALNDKLSFDPDRAIRRSMYREVANAFPEYRVFIGGSSSFDMTPAPYDKYFAMDRFCLDEGLDHKNVLYIGDDYGIGGNDEAVYRSDFPFLPINDYQNFSAVVADFLPA
jgi:hydroxymethylpyrimidine pyrophosphatase-like HAD family hydrolase